VFSLILFVGGVFSTADTGDAMVSTNTEWGNIMAISTSSAVFFANSFLEMLDRPELADASVSAHLPVYQLHLVDNEALDVEEEHRTKSRRWNRKTRKESGTSMALLLP
jgi:hypothetical protein